MTFDKWWKTKGSGITPLAGHDIEEHSARIAWHAWYASKETKKAKARIKSQGLKLPFKKGK